MHINMNKLLRIWCLLSITLVTGCSVGDDAYYTELRGMNEGNDYEAFMAEGTYEGEWTVNKQVVDTARLVVNKDMMLVRLPESYLLTYFYAFNLPVDSSGKPDHEKMSEMTYVPQNTPIKILVSEQGYSEVSQYMTFKSATYSQSNYSVCSFDAIICGEHCRISLLSKENATAVLQNATGQWTLGIPIDAFLVMNLDTDEQTIKELSNRVTIYYITRRRIG